MCGELLHPVIAEYVAIMRRDGQWRHSDEATGKLLAMSERTVKRRLAHFERARGKRRGLSSTKPSSLKSIIPIFKGPWKELPPGHKQVDTLAHCGTTLLGDFIYTVSATDAATYWMQSRAQWNKGEEATVASLDHISEKSSFPDIEYPPIRDRSSSTGRSRNTATNGLSNSRAPSRARRTTICISRRGMVM